MKRIMFAICAAVLLLAGCKGSGGEAAGTSGTAPENLNEAPEFVQLVKEGKLPPLEERLPKNPKVVTPYEKAGIYGGDWRIGLVGGSFGHVITRSQGYENLVRWTTGWGGVEPNIAESYDVSDDSSEYTFHLREGMKWSDGDPFDADDIMFWYEDVLLHPQLRPGGSAIFMQNQEPARAEKLDQYTVRFNFPGPNGLFLQQLAQVGNIADQYLPKHYFSQFHIKYNPNADSLAKAQGFADWVALFTAKGGLGNAPGAGDAYYQNGEMPVLDAWMWSLAPGVGSASQAIAVRNPYYWKVDTEGNQLPYIDRIVYDLLQDAEVLILKILNGEIDWQDQFFATSNNRPIIYENQEKGGYHLFSTSPTEPNFANIQFNLNHPDPAMRTLFTNY